MPTVALLTACGGSGGGDVSANANFTTLRIFSDGAGVGQGVASNGTQTVFIAPNIVDAVALSNQNNPVSDIQFSEFPIVETGETAVMRRGSLLVEGQVADVTIVEDRGREASLVYLVSENLTEEFFAVGSAFGSAPNGAFTYNGVHIIEDRFSGIKTHGTFALTANFSDKTFNYNGDSSTVSIETSTRIITENISTLSGSGTIDTINGRFSSNNLSSNVGGGTGTATMYGQLNGSSAQSVSGVFHTNEGDPFYAGAFVGSR